MTEVSVTPVITCVQEHANWVTGTAAVLVYPSALPLKDRKILGAERGSLEGGSPPDDKARRASSQHSLSHNIAPVFVNRGEGRVQELWAERDERQ